MDGQGRDINVKVYGKPAPLVSLSVELVLTDRAELYTTGSQGSPPIS